MGVVRDRWGHWCELACGAAVVLDRPLQLMLDRAWIGGAAPRFEQDLAGRRQALQTAWQHVLETMAANEAAEQLAQPGLPGPVGSQVPSRLGVPAVATRIASSAPCYPAGAFTGVDVEGFTDLAHRLSAAGPALLEALDQLPSNALNGIIIGTQSLAGDLARIRQIADWARTQGGDIAARLELILRADTAAGTGLTGPAGIRGRLVSTATAGTLLFAPAPSAPARAGLTGLAHGDATALPILLKTQRAGYDPALAAQISLAWTALTPAQRTALLQADPASLGNLDGIPATTRDQANRVVLTAQDTQLRDELARHQQLRTRLIRLGGSTVAVDQEISRINGVLKGIGAIRDRMASTTGVPVLLLGFDPARHGQAIVAFGNPDTATDTITYVPGLTTKLSGAGDDTKRALRTYQQATQLAAKVAPGHTVASVYWLESVNLPRPHRDGLIWLRPRVGGRGCWRGGRRWCRSR